MSRYRPTLFLSFALVSLTVALTLTAYLFGLIPDGYKAELDARAKVAESLAIQLADAANREDGTLLETTMESVVERNEDVKSLALRRANGEIVYAAGDHDAFWVPLEDNRSTPTHVSVPLLGTNGQQGAIEIAFGPASATTRFFGVPLTLLLFIGFICVSGFGGYFFVLRRSLRELDPSRVIPERVQKAFDTLGEGVIILDERQRIMLTNRAFAAIYGEEAADLSGTKINSLSWRMLDGRASAGGYPWHTAMREDVESRSDTLSLRTPSGAMHNVDVSATVIKDEKGASMGAIVTLSDMTGQKRARAELQKAMQVLKEREEEVARQDRELQWLNSHDVETGLFNRRALVGEISKIRDGKSAEDANLSVIIVGLPSLAALRERSGPLVADRIVAETANGVRNSLDEDAIVGRYTEATFAVVLPSADPMVAADMAERIRQRFLEATRQRRSGASPSFGVHLVTDQNLSPAEIMGRATEALNAALNAGELEVRNWDSLTEEERHMRAPQWEGDIGSGGHPHHSVEGGPNPEDEDIVRPTLQVNFLAGLEEAIERASVRKHRTALVIFSVAAWDYYQEALGEAVCELIMRTLKRMLEPLCRNHDRLIVQQGAGNLWLAIDEADQIEDVVWQVERALERAAEMVELPDQRLYVTCRAGIAAFPEGGTTAEQMLRNAGLAARRAINDNPMDGYLMFSNDMLSSASRRLVIETAIHDALASDQFELYFQPIVDANTGALTAAEALLRCTHPAVSDVRMDEIIAVAEESSLIADVDYWVVTNALKQMQEWCDNGLNLPKVSINISAKQLSNVGFMDQVFDAVKSARFDPSRVQVEVTETARMADVEIAAPQLKRLQNLGVYIALDDFGTGQASLTYLQRLHPDVIKIDRSFADGVNVNHANATMVGAMTVMAHCLGLRVVVEGVEDEEQLDFLREARCDEIQGYVISKPMPATVMSRWMASFAPKPRPAIEQATAEADAA